MKRKKISRMLSVFLSASMLAASVPAEFVFAEEFTFIEAAEDLGERQEYVLDEALSEAAVSEGIIPEETIPEEIIPEETIPEETIPKETIPEETIPEETIPEETIPEETIPEETIPEETIPEETIPEEIISNEAIPEGLSLFGDGAAAEKTIADGSVEINEKNFPDKNFREWISSNITGAWDGVLTKEELNAVTQLNLASQSIGDLTGIQYFKKLERLEARNNQLTKLNLQSNTALGYLSVSDNQLTKLDVSANTALSSLDVNDNQLTELVSANKELFHLEVSGNQLKELDVSADTALNYLFADNNQLEKLDISANKILWWLVVSDNPLKELDISANTELSTLVARNNQLTELDISANKELYWLDVSDNQLKELDVRGYKKLWWLRVFNNQLTKLDVSTDTNLGYLGVTNNQLKKLDVSSNKNLGSLECVNNQLTELNLKANENLGNLSCGNNRLTELNLKANKNLRSLECSNNQLAYLDLSNNHSDMDVTALGNRRTITLGENQTFDLTNIKGFDPARVSNLTGGTLNGNILKVNPETTEVTYKYQYYKGVGEGTSPKSEIFTLVIQREQPKPVSNVSKVTGLNLSSTSNSVKLTWKKASGATAYRVQRYNTKTKKYVTVKKLKGTSYTDTKLSPATAYTYRVCGYNSKKTGSYSSAGKVLTLPSTVGSVKIKRSGSKTNSAKAVLTFKESAKASYYDIYKYNKKNKKYEAAFRVQDKTLYVYNAETRKYSKVNSVKVEKGVITCTLTKLTLKKDGSQKYMIKAVAKKSGYGTKTSTASEVVTLK